METSTEPAPMVLDLARLNHFKVGIGEDLPQTDRDIYSNGQVVLSSGLGKDVTESICEVLRHQGFRVDWNFHKGRIFVKTLDDVEVVRAAWFKLLEK